METEVLSEAQIRQITLDSPGQGHSFTGPINRALLAEREQLQTKSITSSDRKKDIQQTSRQMQRDPRAERCADKYICQATEQETQQTASMADQMYSAG